MAVHRKSPHPARTNRYGHSCSNGRLVHLFPRRAGRLMRNGGGHLAPIARQAGDGSSDSHRRLGRLCFRASAMVQSYANDRNLRAGQLRDEPDLYVEGWATDCGGISAFRRRLQENVVADDGESVSTRYTANDGRAGLAQRLLCSPLRAWLDRSRAVSSDRRLFVDKLFVVDQAIARPPGPFSRRPIWTNTGAQFSYLTRLDG